MAATNPLAQGMPASYQAVEGEPYMSDAQLAHFRKILLDWKESLLHEVDRTVNHMRDESTSFPDPNDRATQEEEFGLELRTRDRDEPPGPEHFPESDQQFEHLLPGLALFTGKDPFVVSVELH